MRLPPAFHSRPTLGQFARAGAWEEAWSFPVEQPPAAQEVRRYLAGGNEVAIEAFFGHAFIGARFSGSGESVESRALHCLARMAQARNGSELLASWVGSANGGRTAVTLAHAEVGATNAWTSVGAYRIDDPAEALRNLPALLAALSSTAMAHGAEHRPALELNYTGPLQHWIGLPLFVGDGPHELDPELLRLGLEYGVHSLGDEG